MKRAFRVHIAVAVAWMLATVAHFAFYHDEPLGIFTPLLGGVLALAAVGLCASAVVAGLKGRSAKPLAIAVLVAAVAATGWRTPVGTTFGARCKLWRGKARYEAVVAEVAAGADAAAFDLPVIVDPGPPIRVAFSWGGILDNWRGLIHDPTGEVMKANLLDRKNWSNRDDPEYAAVSGFFGGTLVRSRHLGGAWYLCWFT